MPNSGSTTSFTDSTGLSVVSDTLQLRGYHFKGAPLPSLAHGENVDMVSGYRISNMQPVVAKVSPNSLRLEREFYIVKRLYQFTDGPQFLVRPLEYLNLPTGLTVAIYADEGQTFYHAGQQLGVALDDPVLKAASVSERTARPSTDDMGMATTAEQQMLSQHRRRSRGMADDADDLYLHDQSLNGPMYCQTVSDLGTFLHFAIKCTDCLEFIHRHNVIHGEVRPSALQWTGEDDARVKMWNFGSGSRSFEAYLTSEGWRKTASGCKDSMEMLQNLLAFMSPEQTGRTNYVPDHRSDIYSLGIVFFTILTGRSPFDGSGPLEVLNGVLSKKVPLVHELQLDVPEIVSRIIERMTQKSPDERYSSAYGVKADLKACLDEFKASGFDRMSSVMFPLAEHDIASVFTLPKTMYGREGVITDIVNLIHRFAGHSRNVTRSQRDRSYATNTSSARAAGCSAPRSHSSTADSVSDVSAPDVASLFAKSAASPSYCSGLDGSDVSSTNNSRQVSNRDKQGVTIVAVSGMGGVGKSTVLSAVQSVARQHGYVASTKSDSRHKIPYGCILLSLSQILQQILSESEEEVKLFYDHLKNLLGTQFCNIELLTSLVPELKQLLYPTSVGEAVDPVNQVAELDNVETRVRFHNLFIEVFRALARWRMVTLFLDDVHQMDDPSLELIYSLITSRVRILLLVSYRDQENTVKLDEIVASDMASVHHVRLEALDFDSMVSYISDALHRRQSEGEAEDRTSVLPLAEVAYKKTRGNAFYFSQLLLTLEKSKLIFFNWETNEWDYNLAEIQQTILTHEDVETESELDVDFLVSRLRELPRDGQHLLKWASFVGDTFSWKTVKHLMMHSDSESDDNSSQPDTASNSHEETENTAKPLHALVHTSAGAARPSKEAASRRRKSRDPINGLQAALQEGYIVPLDQDQFKWTHDRYSQAAMELSSPAMREDIHLRIVQYLMDEPCVDSFTVSDHILKCMNSVQSFPDKDKYRTILIEAGDRARSSGAHSTAFNYYMSAIRLLDEDKAWKDDYTSTQSLFTSAVSLSWVVGESAQTEYLLDSLFKQTHNAMDRITAYRIQHKYYFARQLHDKGRGALFRCLEELGIPWFQHTVTRDQLDIQFKETHRLLLDMGGLEAVNAFTRGCQEDRLRGVVSILEELCTVAYWLGHQSEMFYLACKIVHISLTDGMCAVSGIGMAFMGMAAVEVYGMYAFGEELGMAGVSMCDRFGGNGEKGRALFVYANFLLQWKRHYREAIPLYRNALQLSLSAGDRIYASFSQLSIAAGLLFTGEDLSDTLDEAESCYDEVHAWSTSVDSNILIMAIIRTVKALQGQTFNDDPDYILDGMDGFNSAHFISESCSKSANAEVPMSWYNSFLMIPLVLYGYHKRAIELGEACKNAIHNHPLHRHTRLMLAMYSLALIEVWRESEEEEEEEEKEALLARVRDNQMLLRPWAEHGNANYVMLYTLVEAELASTDARACMKAIQLYEKAIDQARQGHWFFELSLAHEYAGGFYVRMEMYNAAYGLIRKAVHLYKNNGSFGKARQLSDKYDDLLRNFDDDRVQSCEAGIQTDPFPYIDPQGAWSTSSLGIINMNEPFVAETIQPVTTEQTLLTLDILDMASILKSSQVISSEVKFDSLLKSMMTIILENSGADCGAVIVKDERVYGMCAYGSQQEGTKTFEPPQPLNEEDLLISSRIVHHAIRTMESVFIYDVSHDPRFAVGPWFERASNKSVICMPIIHKGTPVGCLFLEGASGIFTQRHITVLSLLCQQMGISVSNAFLFKSVQRATYTNMRMIEMQKQALEDARKSKEAAVRATRLREIFLANMSHEIRTPFSGFYGMISLLSETRLDDEQRDLVKTAKESCEILLRIIDDLLNFSKLQAGKMSLDISHVVIEDMIADVMEMLSAMPVQKHINVTYTMGEDVPRVVFADGNRLRQVIINLLGNAIKFTHQGEIYIRCSVDKKRACAKDQVALLFEVVDTGIGISEEQRKILFVPFSQVDGSTTRKYGGTGLGLSICLQLVQLMSGTIDVSSEPDRGSNFFFTVCVSRVDEDKDTSAEVEVQNELQALEASLSQVKVLVAGKYSSTIEMIRCMLPRNQVDGVHTLDQLMDRIKQMTYDVVIVGLFLNREFDETLAWKDQLEGFPVRMLIMHYPSGAGPEFQRNHWIKPVEAGKAKYQVARIAVPLRRSKLLRALADMAHPDKPRPAVVTRKSSGGGTITAEERDQFQRMRILVAEDNKVARDLLCRQLKRLDFLQVVPTNNGQEAVETWLKEDDVNHFTMAFFDHHMPKWDGVKAARRIREIEEEKQLPRRFPIVALTADVQDSARQTCMEAGMDEYLTKPLNQRVLAETLRRHCKITPS